MKSLSVGAELFHADRRETDMTKLIVAFRKFGKVPREELRSLPALI